MAAADWNVPAAPVPGAGQDEKPEFAAEMAVPLACAVVVSCFRMVPGKLQPLMR